MKKRGRSKSSDVPLHKSRSKKRISPLVEDLENELDDLNLKRDGLKEECSAIEAKLHDIRKAIPNAQAFIDQFRRENAGIVKQWRPPNRRLTEPSGDTLVASTFTLPEHSAFSALEMLDGTIFHFKIRGVRLVGVLMDQQMIFKLFGCNQRSLKYSDVLIGITEGIAPNKVVLVSLGYAPV